MATLHSTETGSVNNNMMTSHRASRAAAPTGNKQLVLAGVIAFLGVNGQRLTLRNDQAYDLVMAVATGRHDDLEEISARLGEA